MRMIIKKSKIHFINYYDFIGFYAAKKATEKISKRGLQKGRGRAII